MKSNKSFVCCAFVFFSSGFFIINLNPLMMKKITLLFFVLFAFIIYSCNESQLDSEESMELGRQGQDKNGNNGNNNDGDDLPFIGPAFFESIEDDPEYCGEPVECPFIAGQNINAGSVTVSNDENYLYVKVYSKAGFQDVSENIKMWIGLTPPDRRPPSGQFPYKVTEAGDTHIFKIELSTLPEWDECGKQYVIIVHGDVLTEEGNSGSGETAYGGCELTGDQPWWAYMDYTTQCCEEEENLYAYSYKMRLSDNSSCYTFEKNGEEQIAWTTIYSYDFLRKIDYVQDLPLFLNPDRCDLENTENYMQIGRIDISLSKVDPTKLIVTYFVDDEYSLETIDLYAGFIEIPLKADGTLNDGVTESDFYRMTFNTDTKTYSIEIPWEGSGTTEDQKIYISAHTKVVKP